MGLPTHRMAATALPRGWGDPVPGDREGRPYISYIDTLQNWLYNVYMENLIV